MVVASNVIFNPLPVLDVELCNKLIKLLRLLISLEFVCAGPGRVGINFVSQIKCSAPFILI